MVHLTLIGNLVGLTSMQKTHSCHVDHGSILDVIRPDDRGPVLVASTAAAVSSLRLLFAAFAFFFLARIEVLGVILQLLFFFFLPFVD